MQVEIRCSDSMPVDVDVDVRTDETSSYTVPEFGLASSENKLYESQLKDFADKLGKLQCEVDALYARKFLQCRSIDQYTSMCLYFLNELKRKSAEGSRQAIRRIADKSRDSHGNHILHAIWIHDFTRSSKTR